MHVKREIYKMSRVQKDSDGLRKEGMLACLEVFREKGLKFTMADVANKCHISKKTLYLIYDNKDDLFLAMVDYVFNKVRTGKEEILADEKMSNIDKLRYVLASLPDDIIAIDFGQLYSLKDKYPSTYEQIEIRMESDWDPTIELIKKCQEEGSVRKDINITIIKTMVESSLEHFFRKNILIPNKLTYHQALEEVIDVIIEGIRTR